jgi:hypothetical protein
MVEAGENRQSDPDDDNRRCGQVPSGRRWAARQSRRPVRALMATAYGVRDTMVCAVRR